MHAYGKGILGICLLVLLAAPVLAQDKPAAQEKESIWTAGFELDANSKYIWRSLAWSEGAVMQPSAWVGVGGFTFSLWSNYVLNSGEANAGQFNEVDFRMSYDIEVGDFTITPAFNAYTYPNQDPGFSPTTGELEIGIAYALGDFGLETGHFFDVMDNKGGYVGDVALTYESDVAEGLTLAGAVRFAFANAKFNEYYVPYDSGTFSAVVLEAGLTYTIGGFYVRPHIEYNNILDKNLREAIRTTDWLSLQKPSLFNIGVAAGFEF
ncbi:MAG: hypothetical protein PHI34_03685 [Acidobacteriota bacterium]|nr:hypothetical protein [Acidobacteriota bacterium]